MAEEPLSVAKLPSLKPSSGKEHTMSQHHGEPALGMGSQHLDQRHCSTVQGYAQVQVIMGKRMCGLCVSAVLTRRSLTEAFMHHCTGYIYYVHTVHTVHTEWTNYTATYITVHNHKNIFEGVPSVIDHIYNTQSSVTAFSQSHVFQAYMSSLSPTMVSPTSIVGEIRK